MYYIKFHQNTRVISVVHFQVRNRNQTLPSPLLRVVNYKKIRFLATREQAYVYAVSSAALTYAMARACASGSLHQCTCAGRPGESPKGDFKWGGCGDNVKFGKNFAKRFLDDAERRHERISREGKKNELVDEKMKRFKGQFAEVNLHNNRVGRRVSRPYV